MNSQAICSIPTLNRRDVFHGLVLVLTAILFHTSIVFQGNIPLDEDSLLFFYPLRSLHADTQTGYWDSYLFCGFPREANPQSQLLYAPNVLFHILPTPTAYAALLIGHTLLGALLMMLLLRGLHLSSESALFGAFAFLLSTFWRCKITNLGLLEGISWIPGVLYFYLISLGNGRWTPRMACALFLAMVILAGVPHTVLYTFLFLLFLTIAFVSSYKNSLGTCVVTFIGVTGSAILLTVGMWLPALLYLPETTRTHLELSNALEGSITWSKSWKIFLGGLAQPDISRCDPWEGTCYIGATALFFLPSGVRAMPKKLFLALAMALGFAFFCTLGNQGLLYPLFYKIVPGWDTLNLPNRSLVLAALALPIAAAFGLQRWLDQPVIARTGRFAIPIAGFLLLIFVGIFIGYSPASGKALLHSALTKTFQSNFISDDRWALLSFVFWTALTLLAIFLATGTKPRTPLAVALLLLFLAAQSWLYSPRLFLQTTSPDYFIPPANVNFLQKQVDDSGYRVCGFAPLIDTGSDVRMALLRPALMHRLPEVYHLSEIQGYDPLFPKSYGELLRAWGGQSRATDSTRTVRLETLPPQLLDLLGVRYVTGYPGQEVLYSGHSAALDKPGSLESPLKTPKEVQAVNFRWLLAGAPSIPQGTLVARVHVCHASETIQTFPVRAGIEIANYIIDYPEFTSRHQAAREFRWFPIPDASGYLKVQQYMSTFSLTQAALIDRVAIEYLSPVGRMAILEIDIQTPNTGGLQLIGQSGEMPVYENLDSLPPAYLTRRILQYDHLEEMIDGFRTLKTGEEIPVYFPVKEAVPFDGSPVTGLQQETPVLKYHRASSDEIRIETQSKFDTILTLSENYSANWIAQVDGTPVRIERANHTFMAIPVAAGEHQVLFTYFPRPFFFAISLGGSMLSFVFLMLGLYPRRWLLPPRGKEDLIKG